ncbi:hypothetical protein ACF1A5_31315 [Streptomyces sp. NPDC014864]|uniref:hypothetical protein n=1 Tax=Streptomyces sp. NPDC014864 TaxID=3364924 RepID=UPI0036F8369B
MRTEVEPPAPHLVAEGVQQILTVLETDHESRAFSTASLEYSENWQCLHRL